MNFYSTILAEKKQKARLTAKVGCKSEVMFVFVCFVEEREKGEEDKVSPNGKVKGTVGHLEKREK